MATYSPRTRPSMRNISSATSSSSTPTMIKYSNGAASAELQVGDPVNVPGGMDGTVKFVGEVKGKQGYFVGVELNRKWAARGKNDGEAEGIKYFTTSVPGAGIFLPITRAIKRASPTSSSGNDPATPTSQDTFPPKPYATPPTPSLAPKFSQSLGPGAYRAPSPAFRPKSRPSLPRPESPLRRTQNASTATPLGSRPSMNMPSHNRLQGGPRFAPSPTPGKMAPRTPKTTSTSHGAPPSFSKSTTTKPTSSHASFSSRDSTDDVSHLRALLAEKNEKIAHLTAEFDAHRSDFRSTLDTLELASTETERVYERKVEDYEARVEELEQKVEDLMGERGELMSQSEDVDSVARQLKGLEEVVMELEEGLEDARRGEAEARGEVEFLRGEVERVRAELRREREMNAVEAKGPIKGESYGGHAKEESYGGPGRNESHGAANRARSPSYGVNGYGSGGMARKEEAKVDAGDADKWCALCEGDGHDIISCPLEKA